MAFHVLQFRPVYPQHEVSFSEVKQDSRNIKKRAAVHTVNYFYLHHKNRFCGSASVRTKDDERKHVYPKNSAYSDGQKRFSQDSRQSWSIYSPTTGIQPAKCYLNPI